MLNEKKSASSGVDQKNLPLPEPKFPKPEKDLPLPEKELSDGNPNPHPQKKSKINIKLIALLLFIFLFILVSGAAGYLFLGKSTSSNTNPTPTPAEQVVCAQEAILCPDGETYVSRKGPTCEFAKCPEIVPENESITPAEDESESLEEITQEPLPTASPNINIQ